MNAPWEVKDGPQLVGLLAEAVQTTVLVPDPSVLIVRLEPTGLNVYVQTVPAIFTIRSPSSNTPTVALVVWVWLREMQLKGILPLVVIA
jgi:hypothetical protein